ncbi:NUDIX domain-containing protein [Oceanivirga salmonicida]|uniref:NUDIX domain-containing protein n=1 Tax=Oceanivirga salmonicida TaxID=1769291 RepID=UPI00082CAB06|nr:NUDIX domain-containing protein [Oceanivirga salmonicida]
MRLKLEYEIVEILNKLRQFGKIYIVGGLVRDKIIGIESNDIDMMSDIETDTLLEVLKEYNPIVYNRRYQIIKFKTQNNRYEIARLREDTGIVDIKNFRRFNFVSDITKDVKRRDFTINAIAYDGEHIIDLIDGLKDIKEQRIKIIGDSETRLSEDKIRILRAFRFMAKLNFDFDENLENAIKLMAKESDLFSNFSKERLLVEFNNIILNKYGHKALKKMFELNVLKYFIPIYDNRRYNPELFYKICKKYEFMILKYKVIDKEMAYALLFSFSAKKKIDFSEKNYEADSVQVFEKFRQIYKMRKKEECNIINLIYYHNIIYKNPSLIMIKRMLLDLVNNNMVCKLINMTKIMYEWEFDNENINKILYNIQRLYLADEPVFISDLEVLNIDLYNLNLDSKKFFQMKKQAFKEVLNGKLSNTKDQILKSIISKNKLNIELKEEICAGAVVYRKIENKYQFLIIKGTNGGSWGFPKGHVEYDELLSETAIREIKEETSIDVSIINTKNFVYAIKYIISPDIYKEVNIFLARANNYEIKIDELELEKALWLDFNEAVSILTYQHQRNILRKAMLYIYEDER